MKRETIIQIIAAVAIFAAGWLIGRNSVTVTEEVRYIKGETIIDTVEINRLVEVEVKVPEYIDRIIVRDSTGQINEVASDKATVEDWNLTRKYKDTLFDTKEDGSLRYEIEVNKNKLVRFAYERTPVTREIVKEKSAKYEPFISATYLTDQTLIGAFGIKKGKIGASIGMGYDMKNYNKSLSVSATVFF